MNKPNFFIVGAMKAATTSVNACLKQHPHVFMCPIKEPNYFSKDIDEANFSAEYRRELFLTIDEYIEQGCPYDVHIAHVNEWHTYLNLYQNVKREHAIGESSITYLFSDVAAEEIYKEIPKARIIIILRDPVDRAYSQYLMNVRIGLEKASFLHAVHSDQAKLRRGWGITKDYVQLGLYYEQVKRYLNIFPSNQVRIYLYDDLKTNFVGIIKNMSHFLGLQDFGFAIQPQVYNQARLPIMHRLNYILQKSGLKKQLANIIPNKFKTPLRGMYYSRDNVSAIKNIERQSIQQYFVDDICKLERLISKDLQRWKEER